MLVLGRVERESIVIVCPDGTQLTVKVAKVRGNKVRLAIDAPRTFKVHRGELEDKANDGPQ